ncbi:MAG TPA: hypothetical protein VJH95_00050 [Candidatus Nanoarchaeia archaeon]|nr:hypothetical protein [Candidatus Nanoarchaeia archaeon]
MGINARKIASGIVYGKDGKRPPCLENIARELLEQSQDPEGIRTFYSGMRMLTERIYRAGICCLPGCEVNPLSGLYERMCSLVELTMEISEDACFKEVYSVWDATSCLLVEMAGKGLALPNGYKQRVISSFGHVCGNYPGSEDLIMIKNNLVKGLGKFKLEGEKA